MANPQKGEIEFQIGDKTYVYLLGTYGLAKLEQRMGKPWPAILKDAVNEGWGVDIALACFHCGLLLYHEPISEREASLLLDELTLARFTDAFLEVIKLQFPAAVEGEGEERPPDTREGEHRPTGAAAPKAGNGAGIPSSAIG